MVLRKLYKIWLPRKMRDFEIIVKMGLEFCVKFCYYFNIQR